MGRFSGRLATKDDERRLADECKLLGPLLGGVGKRGDTSRQTLAKIVRGIASGQVRAHCEERERQIEASRRRPRCLALAGGGGGGWDGAGWCALVPAWLAASLPPTLRPCTLPCLPGRLLPCPWRRLGSARIWAGASCLQEYKAHANNVEEAYRELQQLRKENAALRAQVGCGRLRRSVWAATGPASQPCGRVQRHGWLGAASNVPGGAYRVAGA